MLIMLIIIDVIIIILFYCFVKTVTIIIKHSTIIIPFHSISVNLIKEFIQAYYFVSINFIRVVIKAIISLSIVISFNLAKIIFVIIKDNFMKVNFIKAIFTTQWVIMMINIQQPFIMVNFFIN